jgi:diguanylate cyclase (GGDEF)-like protein/PAS domain S-box-containing protein
MQRSEERHRTLVQHAADVVSVSDRDGVTTYVSSTVERVFGYAPEDMIDRDNSDLIHPDDLRIAAAAGEALAADPSHEQRFEVRSRHGDGSWRWHEVTLRDLFDHPAVEGLVSNYRDVTDRKALEDRLRHLAYHDPLTGLANRGMFAERLAALVARKAGDECAVMIIDLDDFKTINDSLGHDVGDRLLSEVAEQLSSVIREGDVLARLGGDEFALLLENVTDDETCATVAERVAAAATRTFAYEGSVFPITASIGVARGDAAIRHADELTRRADVAMYVSKTQGKARWTMFRPGMHLAGEERLFLRSALSQALANDELDVHYQPIVDLSSGAICGMEALMRWRHPELGMVSPAEFIPVAEESGLIGPLGEWVLRRACRQIALWRCDYPTLTISVNVAARQLRDPAFPEIVRSAIDDAQLPPSALVLELTESSSLDDELGTLRLLNELGVRLAIDDFGTGYSSLSYLQRLPIDVLKIDRSFVRDVDDVPRAAAIVDAIVRLGQALGVRLVAEGVEQTGQAGALQNQGCQLAQGYLFAAPLDAAAAENYLRERRDTGVPNIPSQRAATEDSASRVRR